VATAPGILAERRLQAWLKLWTPVFALGGLGFYLAPGLVTTSLNRQGARLGMEASPVEGESTWIVLAVAYMVLVTVITNDAAEDPLGRQSQVRYLIAGKSASSLGSLGYFLLKRRSFAFLANFLLDGAIAAGTYKLLQDARRSS
jgi:hypothetical protein